MAREGLPLRRQRSGWCGRPIRSNKRLCVGGVLAGGFWKRMPRWLSLL